MIYGHGDDRYASDVVISADFSTNVWYGADNAPLVRFLQKRIPVILHYPEPDADSFAEMAANMHGVPRNCILAGNGSTELIYLIARAWSGCRTTLFYPSFSEYEDACTVSGHSITYLPAGGADRLPECDLAILCNPNNPDGRVTERSTIEKLAAADRKRMIVVDESFIRFTRGDNSVADLAAANPNIAVVRSMTKNFAIPGLRLGYMIASPEITERVGRFAFPWRVNALALEAGKFLLSRGDSVGEELEAMFSRRDNFQSAIVRLKGFEPKYSDTVFFLVKTKHDVPELKKWLLDEHGILIRDASNFRGLNRHWFRVNTLNEKRNAMLVEALSQYNETMKNET